MVFPSAFLLSVCSSQKRRTFQAADQLSMIALGRVRCIEYA